MNKHAKKLTPLSSMNSTENDMNQAEYGDINNMMNMG